MYRHTYAITESSLSVPVICSTHISCFRLQIRQDSPPRHTETRTVGSHTCEFSRNAVIEVKKQCLGPSSCSIFLEVRGEPCWGRSELTREGGDTYMLYRRIREEKMMGLLAPSSVGSSKYLKGGGCRCAI